MSHFHIDYIAVATGKSSRILQDRISPALSYCTTTTLPCHQRWRYLQIVPQHNIDWADFTTGAVPWDLAGYFLHCHEWGITKELLSLSGDLGIGLVWDNRTGPDRDFSVRLFKSSSNWTKLSMRSPQLFSGWYQMILDVFRCSQQFSDVFRLFSDCFLPMFSDCWNPLQAELNYIWWVLSYSQVDIRWF